MVPYNPDIYVFQSGKRTGQTPVVLMFQDYGILRWMLSRVRKEEAGSFKNDLHLHLEWLINAGEEVEPTQNCPICKERKVRSFAVRWGHAGDFSIDRDYTFCEKEECKQEIQAFSYDQGLTFLPFKFSSLLQFRKGGDRKRIVNLLKWAFGIEGRITRERAFHFFLNNLTVQE